MAQNRKWSAAAKFKIALQALNGNTPLTEIFEHYKVSQGQVHAWKKQLLEQGSQLFKKQEKPVALKSAKNKGRQIKRQLQEQIDDITKERDFLKRQLLRNKQIDLRQLVDFDNTKVSLRRQCELLDLNRSTIYYDKKPPILDSNDLLNEIRSLWEKNPSYGYRRITKELRDKGVVANHKRVQRLMVLGGMQAIYSGPNANKQGQLRKLHKYLLQE
ncbi:MAG: transposase IS3/IS911 family protein [uncultured bacterium]|nr:MAG: transposase IS3/IS911 family protein [uncultured bacterium]